MTVLALEHVTIRCTQRQRTRDFYVELLGLTEGARPVFRSAAIGSIWAGCR